MVKPTNPQDTYMNQTMTENLPNLAACCICPCFLFSQLYELLCKNFTSLMVAFFCQLLNFQFLKQRQCCYIHNSRNLN